MAFLSSLYVWLGLKSSLEKLMCLGVIVYAIKHKENVAAKYSRGTFEIVATGSTAKRLP
jgi:hypothetical protein